MTKIFATLLSARDAARSGDTAGALQRVHQAIQAEADRAHALVQLAFMARNQPELDAGIDDPLQAPDAIARWWLPGGADSPGPLAFLARPFSAVARAAHQSQQFAAAGSWDRAASVLVHAWMSLSAGAWPTQAPRVMLQLVRVSDTLACPFTRAWATYVALRFPQHEGSRLMAARLAVEAADWDPARALAEPVLKTSPWNRVAHHVLALVELATGDCNAARDRHAKWGISHAGDDLAELALCLDAATSHAVPSEPAAWPPLGAPVPSALSADRLASRAEATLGAGEFEDGWRMLTESPTEPSTAKVTPAQQRCLALRGYAAHKTERHAEAARCFVAAWWLNPTDGWLLGCMGQALLGAGHYSDAQSALGDVTPIGPDDWGAYFNLGLALTRAGHREAGRRIVRESFRRHYIDTLENLLLPLHARVMSQKQAA